MGHVLIAWLAPMLIAANLILAIGLAAAWWWGRRGRRSEQMLRAEQARYSGILEVAEDAIVSVDRDQTIILFNRGAERTFGYTADEVLGKSLDLLIPDRSISKHRHDVDRFGADSAPSRRMAERNEVYGKRKDGSEFPAEASISKLSLPDGVIYTAALRDVTERKEAEASIRALNLELEARVHERTAELEKSNRELQSKSEEIRDMTQQLWQAAKLASVGELAASIAHELNNPLATVSLRLEALLDQVPSNDPHRRAIVVVDQEVERMSLLVGNLLQFSRRGREQVSTVDLRDELRRTLELTHYHFHSCRIHVVEDYSPDLPTIHGDRQKLRQVFLNLFTNASDAMPQGGTLTLRGHMLPSEEKAVVVEVEDTGTGISAENLPRVTDPFFTTKAEGKGTGLGLAICRRIIHEHNGKLSLQSEVGKGTVVRIELPMARPTNVKGLE